MFSRQQSSILKSSVGILILVVTLFGLMEVGNSKTIFNELMSDLGCSEAGEHGCLCYKNLDCNATHYLECIDGKCACEFPLRRTFDKNLGRCVSLVGSFCGGWIPECIRNSECEGGRCTCRAGYSKTVNSSCMINFGEECGPAQCNSERGLACKEGSCRCVDSSYVYSAIHTNCIDPEAVVRNFIMTVVQRFVRGFVNFKIGMVVNTITKPFRVISRLALGPLALVG